MNIFFATKVRGFFKHLLSSSYINHTFITSSNNLYELNGKGKKWLSNIVRSNIGDLLGIIQIIKCENKIIYIITETFFTKCQ